MNLMERKNRKDEQEEQYQRLSKEEDLEVLDFNEPEEEDEEEEAGGLQGLLRKPYMTTVLMGIIVVLLLCIIVLLVFMPSRKDSIPADADTNLQQNITDYAKEQKEKEKEEAEDKNSEAVVVKPSAQETVKEEPKEETEEEEEPETTEKPEAADSDKTAVVVDIEDENDEAYTKEFILNEALPYFADNKQDAIWDLAHLKRYVKLSKELEGTGKFYYQGDVDGNGRPNGKGLAIYEQNSYY